MYGLLNRYQVQISKEELDRFCEAMLTIREEIRAVENGMSIYRQTGSGVSVVTDAYGRVIQRVDTFEEANTGNFAAVHTVATPIGSVNTLYPRIGDSVGNIMLVALTGLLLGLFLTRKRQAVQPEVGTVTA